MHPAALLAALALSASAQPSQPAKSPQPAGSADILYIYSSGLHEMLASPKDQGLRSLLAGVPDRLIELAAMSGASDPSPDRVIPPLWTIASSPLTLRVAARDAAEDGGPPVAIELTSAPADAGSLNRQLTALLREGDLETRAARGGREFDTPLGPGWFGVQGDDLRLSVGGDLPAAEIDWNLPQGSTPVFALHANFRNAQPLLQMAFESAGEDDQAAQMRAMFEQSGIMGDDALIVTMAVGHNDSSAVIRGSVQDIRSRADVLGIPQDASLDREFLSLIPADATMVQAGIMSLKSLEQLAEMPEVAQGLEEVNEQLGFDVMNDLLLQIGGRFAMYQSDTTGGGGILSTVGIVELKDARRFAGAHEQLAETFNDLIAEQMQDAPTPMSVQIVPQTVEGHQFFTLAIGGLPIPAEISWTIHHNHLMLALSPRSLLEAMDQAGDGPSFADSRALAEMTRGIGASSLLAVSYTDTPRFAVQGYSIVTLLTSALSNALRTQDGAQPPIALPAFSDFIAGIQPNTMTTYWDGDDIRFQGSCNASFLVNTAGSGTALLLPAAIGAGVGAIVPAAERAREAAKMVKAQANLRHIAMAVHTYSADNRDRLPRSMDDIEQYLEGLELTSPLGPCYDGSPDYALRSDLPRSLARVESPASTMLAVDRASIINGAEQVIVCFLDGHVEAMYSWEFTELLAQEQNQGAFESLALPEWMNPGF